MEHAWEFKPRFRRQAFGWKSQPAITRIKQAVVEIRKVARTQPALAAEGAVLFLERLSPALENIDSSSGAIGTAVNNVIADLIPIVSAAPVDTEIREAWLERLFEAYQNDDIPYIESLGDYWGELCASKEIASCWADRLIDTCKMAWSRDPGMRGFFKGTSNCLSALLAAGRYAELFDLLEKDPHPTWCYRQYGMKALAAQGRVTEAIEYAEEGRGAHDSSFFMARACEEALLSAGRVDEAYERYGLEANRAGTYIAWFRAVAKKYPHKPAATILAALIEYTPGEEGKWFAAAKDAGLLDAAIALANESPCDPKTLTRAARDFAEKNPAFAIEAGMAALHWLTKGYGYEITSLDVWGTYGGTIRAAENAGCRDMVFARIRELMANAPPSSFVRSVLQREVE